VLDLRELMLAQDDRSLSEIMNAPVVAAQEEDVRDTLTSLFAKYNFRVIPVVDSNSRILGVIRYKDVMRNIEIRAKD